MNPAIKQFLTSSAYGVVGASAKRTKFGNKVLRCYLQHGMKVYPVNPHEPVIEGVPCIKEMIQLPNQVKSISIITPPPITEMIIKEAITMGIKNIWIQPGAESKQAILMCEEHYINIIAGGPCILVELGFNE